METRIESRKNPLLQQVRKLLTSRRDREQQGLYVAEGTKLLQEAVRHCRLLHTVVLADGVEVEGVPAHVRVYRVSREIMASLSSQDAPQGALFLCQIPQQTEYKPQRGSLILDGIQDPGNLGTILRTADALDVPVVLLEGCADIYNSKTIRSSMGATFRVPVVRSNWEEVSVACKVCGVPIGVTALSDTAVDIRAAMPENMAVVIGSEGRGVRPEILQRAEHQLIIPMNPHCESLNAAVAASIVMWQMVCRR
jgi:TrmH family RNA methyltransferase